MRLTIATLCGVVFGAALLFLPLSAFFVLLLGVPMALLVLRMPIIGLALFAAMSCFMPYTTVNLGIRFTISEALLGLTWAGVALHIFFQRIPVPRFGKTEWALLLLMAFSVIPFIVGEVTIAVPGAGISNWIRWLANLSPLLLGPLLLRTPGERDVLIVSLLLGNLAMLLLSLAVFAQHRTALALIPILESMHYAHPEALRDILGTEFSRLGTPWVHPNLSGGAMALIVPLAACYGITQMGWRRWLGLAVALLGGVAVLLTSSRGAILALGLVLIWMAWLRVPGTRALLAGALVLGLVTAVAYPPLQQRLATMFSSDNASTEVRLEEYRKFPEAMLRYPLGIGFQVEPPVPGSGLPGISNLWLNYVYKLGLLGMLLYCAVLVHWWRRVRPQGKVFVLNRENGIWLGSTAALVAALLTGLIDHYYSFTMVLVALFWLVMALNLQTAPPVLSPAQSKSLRKPQ